MANLKHMDIIKRGVDSWNTWRINNSHILPSLSDAGLHMAYLKRANLSRADLSDAGLRLADLIEANLKGADLYWANLSEANLRGANLRDANLQGANMRGSNMRSARMNSADMSQANISRANLSNSELIRANLYRADLSGTDLRGAVLKEANLLGTNLTGANLEGADMSNAIVGATLFGNVNLNDVKGLESLLHLGPSTVGIDTIYKSRGNVPRIFLKNAGVPRHLIDYIELFVDRSRKYYSCFISYNEKDEEFALRLFEDLQAAGIRCWLATEKLKKRDRNHAIIDSAVKLHNKVILVLSENSINNDWAENECNLATEKERTNGIVTLVPLVLDDAVKYTDKPWVNKMRRSRYLYDFALWQDSVSYQENLSSLVAGLETEDDVVIHDELFDEEFDDMGISDEAREKTARDLALEFRAERRQFC